MKIYLACGLTHVPREAFSDYTHFLHDLAGVLTSQGRHFVKYALVNSDPQLASKPFEQRAQLCYLWDREMVEEAELIIAEASYPSIGLGIELQLAQQRGTPIIICFCTAGRNKATPVEYENPDHSRHGLQIGDGYVSLMALGLPGVFRVVGYTDPADGISRIFEAVSVVNKNEESPGLR